MFHNDTKLKESHISTEVFISTRTQTTFKNSKSNYQTAISRLSTINFSIITSTYEALT